MAACFLDLPKEIRLMIYERLPRTIRHTTLTVHEGISATLIQPTTPTSILATCRQINDEAQGIVKNTVDKWVLSSGIKVITISSTLSNAVLEHVLLLAWTVASHWNLTMEGDKDTALPSALNQATPSIGISLDEALIQRHSGFDNERFYMPWLSEEQQRGVAEAYATNKSSVVGFIERAARVFVLHKIRRVQGAPSQAPIIQIVCRSPLSFDDKEENTTSRSGNVRLHPRHDGNYAAFYLCCDFQYLAQELGDGARIGMAGWLETTSGVDTAEGPKSYPLGGARRGNSSHSSLILDGLPQMDINDWENSWLR
ncbi:hypothetical protein BDV96DRAFT_586671 [Lophiotrema nucula]|uniref:F-box domain-containing protein n=1 Tax=Lophiotrema nucula TaxID=690887 RepID=A0A6A5YNY7_9PLEO|nr:hypothetical protein BDV96DRAFT_586671 [Lophiotrema nucula]